MIRQKLFTIFTLLTTVFQKTNLTVGNYSWDQSYKSYPTLSEPALVNYDIEDSMIKRTDNNFANWFSIPWNSAYFDIDQVDTKLHSASVVVNPLNYNEPYTFRGATSLLTDEFQFSLSKSDAGTPYQFSENQLKILEYIFFNHNYITNDKLIDNSFSVTRTNDSAGDSLGFMFEVQKPLSFYIQSLVALVDFSKSRFLHAGKGSYLKFHFLDYDNSTLYQFNFDLSRSNFDYSKPFYLFITLPVRVPNLKMFGFELISTTNLHGSRYTNCISQINIFSDKEIQPTPPVLPFSPEYERVVWYDVFGHLRNAFRWIIFGVIGRILPVESLSIFLQNINVLLVRFLRDTLGVFIPVDFLTTFEVCVGIWLFIKFMRFAI